MDDEITLISGAIIVFFISSFTTFLDRKVFGLVGSYEPYLDSYTASNKMIEYHEQRHQQQARLGFSAMNGIIVLVSLILTYLAKMWEFSFLAVVSMISLELDAWLYSIYKTVKNIEAKNV